MNFGVKVFLTNYATTSKENMLILESDFYLCNTKFKMSKIGSFQGPVRIKGAATSLCWIDPTSSVLVTFVL